MATDLEVQVLRQQIADLQALVQRLQASQPDSIAILGPRSDLTGGKGVRVRIGLLSDATYGIERFTSAGTRQTVTWA